MREHFHLIIMGHYSDIFTEDKLNFLTRSIIKSIKMKILGGPYIHYSDKEQHEGYTVLTAIDTSHISIHTWDSGEFQFDLYSCKIFNSVKVIKILEDFSVYDMKISFFERGYGRKHISPRVH